MNCTPFGTGSHCLTVSNIGCMNDGITVFDSAFETMARSQELVVARLTKPESHVLKVLIFHMSPCKPMAMTADCMLLPILLH